jgi:hypothetical protein
MTRMTMLLDRSIHKEPVAMMRDKIAAALSIAFAVALTFCMQGYQFGTSNHTVYLLDALRHASPQLLRNDWFTTQTFQYHALFGAISRVLMSMGILAPGFFVAYVVLVLLLQVAWWRIVRALGGGAGPFLVSQVLFQLMAAGTGLGMYLFLQDSSFLPANVSAVALLFAIALWLEVKPVRCAIALGIAGAFHLNYAPLVILLWVLLQGRALRLRPSGERFTPRFFIASLIALVPATINIGFALTAIPGRSGRMPLAQFVDLYVRLRHPHHYDPSSWPAWLWCSFLLPIPLAVAWWLRVRRRDRDNEAVQYAARITLLFVVVLIVPLICAGVTYVSEPLIQASLFRFSVILKMLTCVGAALLICEIAARYRWEQWIVAASVAVGIMLIARCLNTGPYLGLYSVSYEDPQYLAACDWIRGHTPVDSVFIVPPNEQEFRLRAQRAIVINFKGVPQLSGELPEWRDRLTAVLDLPDLSSLPHPFAATLTAMRNRYREVDPRHLAATAKIYGARYIVTDQSFGPAWEPMRVAMDGNPTWLLYDLSRSAKEDAVGPD